MLLTIDEIEKVLGLNNINYVTTKEHGIGKYLTTINLYNNNFSCVQIIAMKGLMYPNLYLKLEIFYLNDVIKYDLIKLGYQSRRQNIYVSRYFGIDLDGLIDELLYMREFGTKNIKKAIQK